MIYTESFRYSDFYRHHIKSLLIDACIEGGTIYGKHITSYTVDNPRYNFTRYFLTSLIKYAFNIKRRMGFEETYYMPMAYSKIVNIEQDFEDMMNLAHSISDEMFNEAVDEIKKIYHHTQYMLEQCKYIEEDGTVRIYRSLNEIEISQMVDGIENGFNHPYDLFEIETNILLSGERYSDLIYKSYSYKPLKVCLKVKPENIFMHPDFILTSYAFRSSRASSLEHENEVLFFNPHPRGILRFKAEDIHLINQEELVNFLNAVKEKKEGFSPDLQENRFIKHYSPYLNNDKAFMMIGAKMLFLDNHYTELLSSLKPRLRKKVIKELDRG